VAVDTDGLSGPDTTPDSTSVDRQPGPQTAHMGSPASARLGLSTGLGVECFDDRVGDMRLYPKEASPPNLAPARANLAARHEAIR